jgi:hypothetical protein
MTYVSTRRKKLGEALETAARLGATKALLVKAEAVATRRAATVNFMVFDMTFNAKV